MVIKCLLMVTHLGRQTLKDDDERSNYDYMLDHPGITILMSYTH